MVNTDVPQGVGRIALPHRILSSLASELESNIDAIAAAIPRSVLFADLCQIVPYAFAKLSGVNATHLRELSILRPKIVLHFLASRTGFEDLRIRT